MYSIKFTETRKKFYLSLHSNVAKSDIFVNDNKTIKLKAKDYEIVVTPLCLGNISKDWPVDNMKKKLDLTKMFMILVSIMMLLQLMMF